MKKTINEVIKSIESMPLDDQEYFLEIIQKRIIENRRKKLAGEIREAKADYQAGNVKRGNVRDIMNEAD